MKHRNIETVLSRHRLKAVVTMDEATDAADLGTILLENGIGCIELTLRTDQALPALRAIKSKVPDLVVGAGTVIFPEQVTQVKEAGADFAVAPGVNPAVIEEAEQQSLPFAPGVSTPTDIEAAVSFGYRVLKFFPAEPMGGVSYLSALAQPYMHLGLQFVPLGGINEGNLRQYLENSSVLTVGGSWIAPRKAISKKDWTMIANNSSEAMRIVREIDTK